MMFLVYLAMLLGPAGRAGQQRHGAFRAAWPGLDRVLDLLDEPREMPADRETVSLRKSDVAGRVTLQGVSFRYPGSSDWCCATSISTSRPARRSRWSAAAAPARPRSCNLVARFYDPTGRLHRSTASTCGEIDVESYRRLLGIVEQDVFLFDGTVAENIGYAVRGASSDDIERAARVANAHEFIADARRRLPDDHRRARRQAERRPAATAGDRPGLAGRPANSDSRRGHEQSRQRKRAADPAKPRAADAGPHVLRHRPPPEHDRATPTASSCSKGAASCRSARTKSCWPTAAATARWSRFKRSAKAPYGKPARPARGLESTAVDDRLPLASAGLRSSRALPTNFALLKLRSRRGEDFDD